MTTTPVFITTAADAKEAAIAFAGTVSGGRIVSESPARLMYTAMGSDSKIHMYGLDLTNIGTPAPVQIGTLALSNDNQLCDDSSSAENNLYQPSTLWVLVHINLGSTSTTSMCNSGGDVYEVINYTDSSTTAPAIVSVTSTDFDPLYHSTGVLAGLVLQQSTNLNFYASSAFTSPKTLVPNVVSAEDLIDAGSAGQDLVGDTVAFYSVTNSSNTQLYRITVAGTAISVYIAAGTGLDAADRADASNIFFTDVDSTHYRILRAPITSGSAVSLYTANPTAGNYSLVGSNGTVLAITENVTGGNGTVQTISATSATTTPTTIATLTGLLVTDAFLAEATPGTLSSSQIFVNAEDATTGVKSTEVLTTTGTVTQALLANSVIEEFSQAFTGTVYQVRGITDTGLTGQEGGGSAYVYTVGSASVVAFTLSGGGAYTIPASTALALGNIAGSPTDEIGVGVTISAGVTNFGIAADNASHLIVPISFANTSIEPF